VTFVISDSMPVTFSGPLPKAADVVVIGGGVAGVMTAYYLACAGQKVVLCEKGRIAGEQSSRNWGWVRQQGRDPAELPIMIESMRLWEGFSQQLGDALGFRRVGVMFLARNEKSMADYEAWLTHARAHGLDTRLLGRAALQAEIPHHADWVGGLYTASDARAEPWVAVPLLARLAEAAGVVIVENCAVRRLDVAAGRVSGVVTEQGLVAADRVVLAGGAWSSLFARAHGLTIPQLSVRATVAQTQPAPEVWRGNAAEPRFAFRRRADGGYTLAPGTFHEFMIGPDALRHFKAYIPLLRRDISSLRLLPKAPAGYPDGWGTPRQWSADQITPFERIRVLNPTPNRAAINRLQDHFAAAFPAAGRPRIARIWAGMVDTMPDTVPVLDHAPLPGLTIATGLSDHGFGIGPGIGRVVADLVMGRAPGHDLTRFRFGRFTDGSRIDLGPTL